MSELVDIVNFNADASCLSSRRWLAALENGEGSELCAWLSLYVELGKRVVLGFPGATIADIAHFNPEAIRLVNAHPEIFELTIRPFAHDISLLRSTVGFQLNLELGIQAVRQEFSNVSGYYLPPEFMCNSSQVYWLASRGLEGLFIYPARFDEDTASRIPDRPYRLVGLMGSQLTAVPIDHAVSQAYLEGIHFYGADSWNASIQARASGTVYAWRDGESAFLLPDTVAREAAWLRAEAADVERQLLHEKTRRELVEPVAASDDEQLATYPVHSFSAWTQEMKMYWYIRKVQEIEARLSELSPAGLHIWLQMISSDILSAVEKRSPVIRLRPRPDRDQVERFVIQRQAKEFEGEDFAHLFDHEGDEAVRIYLESSDAPHIRKLRARIDYLEKLRGVES